MQHAETLMGIAFLIRHAERNQITNPKEHSTVLLNEIKRARQIALLPFTK